MKDFPIPVRSIGPGSQVEEEALAYMPMPQGMETFRAPVLAEPEELALRHQAHAALRDALEQLERVCFDGINRRVDLRGLDMDNLALVNQVLGEGEVSARVQHDGEPRRELHIQESVFAGVWRVVGSTDGRVETDQIEIGPIPDALKAVARADVLAGMRRWNGPLPPNVQNAPALLAEIEEQWRAWKPGQPAHVVNLTLLPMSVEDIGFLDHHLGTGRVLILSRGYGNCRITNTQMPHCWRVVYYNSQDVVILNTVEVSELPEVAQAAREDLEDSRQRLKEVLEWVMQA
ncbi:hydrogenase expression/formation C-terminal domain-containing protein [Variovorax ureilyticus]|uniref:Hydrogenase expression/formation C-terminal domain-containing protein n=1 Tax=Variovorax ureilyticus TaxID=1836198 RepID=A0ABU8VRV4_9BURK